MELGFLADALKINFMRLLSFILLLFSSLSCTNRDGEIIDLINSVKKQNDDLKAQISALKKTTDSALVAVLKVNTLQTATDKKIDLIQADLKALLAQIASLTTQMTAANADLVSLKTKIDALQAKCAELVAQITALTDSSAPITLKDGLVAYYPFNGNANDVGPNKIVGKVFGAELQSDRFNIPNSAYYFSSANSIPHIESTLNTSSITSALTISIWVLKIGEGSLIPRILEFHPLSIEGPGQLQISFGYQNSWGVFHRNSDSNPFISNIPNWFLSFPIGLIKWTHCVYTIDNSIAKFYQDGILLNTFITVGGKPNLAPNLSIGRVNYPSYDAFYGKLDDLGIWNRVLSSDEVKYLFQHDFKP
jgi:Concanavalin A-like lectin/glucanases superfamily